MNEYDKTRALMFILWLSMLAYITAGQVFNVHAIRSVQDRLSLCLLKEE